MDEKDFELIKINKVSSLLSVLTATVTDKIDNGDGYSDITYKSPLLNKDLVVVKAKLMELINSY